MRCFLVTPPRTFPEPSHSSASHGVSTAESFGFSKGAKTINVWLLWPSVFTVSLNTMSSNKKSTNVPFSYNFHLLGGGISFCFNPHSSVQPGPKLFIQVAWSDSTPFLFSLCMICMSACTAYLPVCLSHNTYQHKSTEGHQYFHCIQTVLSLLLLFCFCWGGVGVLSMLCFQLQDMESSSKGFG